MTSIVAIRKVIEGVPYVVYGHDSQVTFGERKAILRNSHKAVEFPNFTALFAGCGPVQHVLEDIRDRKWKNNKLPSYLQMRNRRDVHRFAIEVTTAVKKKLKDLSAPENEGDDFQLVIATPSKLYDVNFWAFVVETEDFAAGGSGSPYLQAILISNYNSVTTTADLHALAHKSLHTACQIDLYSGLPITVKELRRNNESTSIPQSI